MENMRLQEQLRKYDVVLVSHLVYDLILLLVARHITKACCVSLSTAKCMSTDARVICRFQDFHTSGEREAMAKEIADLRDHLFSTHLI